MNMKYLFSYNIEKSGLRIEIARLNYYTRTKVEFNAFQHMCLTTGFDFFVACVVVFEVQNW